MMTEGLFFVWRGGLAIKKFIITNIDVSNKRAFY